MSKRGREYAELLATRHMQEAGVSKAYGYRDNLVQYYRPLGEGIAVVEKACSKTARMLDGNERVLAFNEQVLSFSGQLLDRAEAFYEHQRGGDRRDRPVTKVNGHHPPRFEEFKPDIPDSWHPDHRDFRGE